MRKVIAGLLAQARTIQAFAFLGLFAWLAGIDPPAWQRVLLVLLASGAIAATAFLDERKIAEVRRHHFDQAA
jgi:hypothetical protein